MKKKMSLTLMNTIFKTAPVVALSASPVDGGNLTENDNGGKDLFTKIIL